jgi:methylthioribulose-1-phosphate dehydratase
MTLQHRNVETAQDAKALICELGRQFYGLGWVSGTGGGISLRLDDEVYMAPSGVQKEALTPDMIFTLDLAGQVVSAPSRTDMEFRVSACQPLFMHAFNKRGAGAVLHSHSQAAVLATLLFEDEFAVTHLEMIKGIEGTGYHDVARVPIIENTAHESDLSDSLAAAMDAHPQAHAVLVRRHGVYVWGRDWMAAKRHAECYDYLFSMAARMKALGLEPTAPSTHATHPAADAPSHSTERQSA